MIKVSLFLYIRNLKNLMKKSSSSLQSTVLNLTECKIQKVSFENLRGITASLSLKSGVEKKDHLHKRRKRLGTSSVYSI